MSAALTEVRLYGHLRRRFGRSYHLAVRSAGEAIRALCVVVPGFRAHLLAHSAPGYKVWMRDTPVERSEQLAYPAGKLVRIVPAIAGAKRGGLGQVFIGAALIASSFFLPLPPIIGNIAMNLGASMVLGGVSQMLAKPPAMSGPAERPENRPSYSFTGAVNTIGQGNAVPVLYGRLRVGGQNISSGLAVAQI